MKEAKILVVEDEIEIAKMIKRVIETESVSNDIALAQDGREGLLLAEKGNYDLILLDVMLPKLNGLEVCKALRYKGVMTPIIMLTAKDTIEDRVAATEAGANEYLSKPFSFDDLLDSAKLLLEKKSKNEGGKKILENEEVKVAEINKRILDNVPVSIVTIDKDGNVTSANKFYKYLSKKDDFKGSNVFNGKFFIRENLVQDYKKLLTDGTMVKRDHCYERNINGEDKYLKIIAVPLLDGDGNIEGAVSMALDNTESVVFRKKLQLLNSDLEEKVVKRTDELKRANMSLSKVLELKAMFVADVSHEMRTSLAIIQGNIELISRGLVEKAEQKKTYGQVLSEISRMSTMLTDMSLLSESETSRQSLDLIKVDINKLISTTCKSLKVVADKKNIKMSHKNSRSKIEITADVVQIEKLMINLLNNAIRYNKENGSVEIEVKNDGAQVLISVKDSGIGIPNEYVENIFERFYRVDKARSRNDGGSGLGLSICKWVAEMHGGSINVESTLGEGSIFTVCLPFADTERI